MLVRVASTRKLTPSNRAKTAQVHATTRFGNYVLFKFSSYKMGVSMNSWFLVTGRIYFKEKGFKYI